jgi:hypothetical protein
MKRQQRQFRFDMWATKRTTSKWCTQTNLPTIKKICIATNETRCEAHCLEIIFVDNTEYSHDKPTQKNLKKIIKMTTCESRKTTPRYVCGGTMGYTDAISPFRHAKYTVNGAKTKWCASSTSRAPTSQIVFEPKVKHVGLEGKLMSTTNTWPCVRTSYILKYEEKKWNKKKYVRKNSMILWQMTCAKASKNSTATCIGCLRIRIKITHETNLLATKTLAKSTHH